LETVDLAPGMGIDQQEQRGAAAMFRAPPLYTDLVTPERRIAGDDRIPRPVCPNDPAVVPVHGGQ